MTYNIKIIISSIVISIVAFGLVGCSADNKKASVKIEESIVKAQSEDKETKNIKEYSKELSLYFPQKDMKEFHYSGTAEYGEVIKLNKVTGSKNNLILQFKGEIKNEAEKDEGPARSKFQFEKEYTINNDSVLEVQKNGEMKKRHAAIEKSTVLKLPIKKGNLWEEEVVFKEKNYKAVTTILEVSKDKDHKKLVKTETVIKGAGGYPEKIYKEIKIYKEGKGLLEFNNTILLGGGNGEGVTPMQFGYKQIEVDNK